MDMASAQIQEARKEFEDAPIDNSMTSHAKAAILAALDQRVSRLTQYTATNLEAATEVAWSYIEFEDYQCIVNEKLNEMNMNRRMDDPLNPSVSPSKQGSSPVKTGLRMSMPCPVHTH